MRYLFRAKGLTISNGYSQSLSRHTMSHFNNKTDSQSLNNLTKSFGKISVSTRSSSHQNKSFKDQNPIPDGWLKCCKFNEAIEVPNLPLVIIPMRAPLDKSIPSLPSQEQWTWDHIKYEIRNYTNETYKKRCSIAAVFDLTATKIDSPKYYKGTDLFKNHKIFYNKVLVVTHAKDGRKIVPNKRLFNEFYRKMDKTIKTVEKWKDPDRTQPVLLVHCTHGRNRTGLFICSYLVEKCGFSGETAIEIFEKCRGETIEHEMFKDYIRNLKPNCSNQDE